EPSVIRIRLRPENPLARRICPNLRPVFISANSRGDHTFFSSKSLCLSTFTLFTATPYQPQKASASQMYAWQLIIRKSNVCLAVNNMAVNNKAVNKKIKNLASLPCVSPQGTIAIKVHNPKSVIHYKNIRLRKPP
ncbi:MAG: hypothetical protein ACK49X_04075, partial [Akkermansiaceae bacterium]